jgi:hypothetical protein
VNLTRGGDLRGLIRSGGEGFEDAHCWFSRHDSFKTESRSTATRRSSYFDPDLGHSPQIQPPEAFHKVLLDLVANVIGSSANRRVTPFAHKSPRSIFHDYPTDRS